MASQRKGFGALGWLSLLLAGGGGFVLFMGYQEHSAHGFVSWVQIAGPLLGLGTVGLALALGRAIHIAVTGVVLVGAGVGAYLAYDHYQTWKAEDKARWEKRDQEDKLERSLAKLCRVTKHEGPRTQFTRDGEGGVEGTKALPAAPKPPLTAVFFMSSEYQGVGDDIQTDLHWANWRPEALEDVDVVGCWGWLETQVGTCQYTMGSVWRSIWRRNVRLFDPSTGTLVKEIDVEGSRPGPCPQTHEFTAYGDSDYSSGSIVGDTPPDDQEVKRQLEAFLGPKSSKR